MLREVVYATLKLLVCLLLSFILDIGDVLGQLEGFCMSASDLLVSIDVESLYISITYQIGHSTVAKICFYIYFLYQAKKKEQNYLILEMFNSFWIVITLSSQVPFLFPTPACSSTGGSSKRCMVCVGTNNTLPSGCIL